MISAPDRQIAVELIKEAVKNGAKAKNTCPILGISVRTYKKRVELF